MFHVALKFQYLHTSALPPCTFALATLKTPGGGSDPGGIKATRGANGGLTMHIMCVKVMLHHHSLALRLHLGHHHSAQNPRKSLRPKHKAMPGKPKAKAMPYHLTTKPKVKAKPKAQPGVAGVSGVAGVAGTKRKNSRSPSAGVKRKTAVRLEAASASSAPSNSGASATPVSLRKPLQGETFMIYSAGRSQASNKDFQSPS